MRILFVFICLFSLSTAANKSKLSKPTYYYKVNGKLSKGKKVVVTEYTKSYGGVFRGYLEKLDGEGFFYFRAEHLAKALGKEPKSILKGSKKIVGKTVTLKKELKTVLAPVAVDEVLDITWED